MSIVFRSQVDGKSLHYAKEERRNHDSFPTSVHTEVPYHPRWQHDKEQVSQHIDCSQHVPEGRLFHPASAMYQSSLNVITHHIEAAFAQETPRIGQLAFECGAEKCCNCPC
jgi:hypothetical protein